jgi:hypothetical protein
MATCAKATSSDRPVVLAYWAPGTFSERNDDFVRSWYSTQLCAMGEVPLVKPSDGRIHIRFLWLRTFHPGIAVRVENDGNDTHLVAIELDGAGGYAPGAVGRRTERSLSSAEWVSLQEEIADSKFWRRSTSKEILGLDGAEWIVEIAEHNRYHVITRWNGGTIEQLGRHLLTLSQLEPDPIY